jgi:hypothetical protein
MVDKQDQRWLRAEAAILQAYSHALEDPKHANQISVTSLAREAGINKATFYLHYRDLAQLRGAYLSTQVAKLVEAMDYLDKFFMQPREFAVRFTDDSFARLAPLLEDPIFARELTSQLVGKLQEIAVEQIGELDQSQTKLLWFICGGLVALISVPGHTQPLEVEAVLGDFLAALNQYRQSFSTRQVTAW